MEYLVTVIFLVISACINNENLNSDYLVNSDMTIEYDSNLIEKMDCIMYANSTIYIRNYYDLDAEKIGFYRENEVVSVTGYIDGWYEVSYNNEKGYVESCYLNIKSPSDAVKYLDYVYTLGDVSYVDDIVVLFEKLPSNFKDHFKNDNSRIIITNKDLGSYIYGKKDSSIKGVCNYFHESGYADVYVIYDNTNKYVIYHELGHYMDYELHYISNSSEFIDIWHEEMAYLYMINNTNPANINTPKEYFAEAFCYYMKNRTELQNRCPKTYLFLEDCLKEM